MNQNKLVSLDDAALDQVNGGASITVTFPTPSQLVKGAIGAVGSVVDATVAAGNKLLGLFGISFG